MPAPTEREPARGMFSETFVATMKDLKLADGRARVVRHGYGPARTIQTGIWPRRGRAGEDTGPRGGRQWRADPVQLGDPAAVGAAHPELGCALAGALPAGHFDRR